MGSSLPMSAHCAGADMGSVPNQHKQHVHVSATPKSLFPHASLICYVIPYAEDMKSVPKHIT